MRCLLAGRWTGIRRPRPLSSLRDGERGYAHPLTLDRGTLDRILAEAATDSESFAEEFPGELLDPASTDWDSAAWGMAPADLRSAPGVVVDGNDYGWPIYQRELVANVRHLVARRAANTETA